MFETIKNALATKEIRVKILLTLAVLLVYRVGCYIPIPGINASAIDFGSMDFLNVLSSISGGALSKGTVFALGITPFINSFIIMQLLTLVIPKLERLSKEGEAGKRKITQITRFVALGLAIVQAIGILFAWKGSFDVMFGSEIFTQVMAVIIMVGGSTIVMWLGERITEYGVGNGTSLIIFIGILSTAGTALINAFKTLGSEWNNIWNILGFLLVVLVLFVFIVFIDLSERRVTVQYSKQVKGNKMYGGQTTHIPIRVNGSGVMPIIFASALLMFPQMIFSLFANTSEGMSKAAAWYTTYMTANGNAVGQSVYYIIFVLLIVFFAYFYAQIQFNPEDVSKNIQQYGGFLPGIRPGKPTSDYLKKINNRITLFGAIFLAIIAVVPTFAFNAIGKEIGLSSAFSATGLLIIVSVALEFNKQLESQIMMRHYKGFL